jgi:hypothetical protein
MTEIATLITAALLFGKAWLDYLRNKRKDGDP